MAWIYLKCHTCLVLYSILILVLLDRCQNKRQCFVVASTDTFRQDPCPRTSKYLKVAYKCNPDNFTNQTVCEGDQLTITCQKSTRIAIYSVLFGRTAQDNTQCSGGTTTAYADCRSRNAVQEVMSRCHGRKRCAIEAEEYVFGNPCPPGILKYLNVVYTCVPKNVLKENSRNRNKKKKKKKKPSTSVDNIDTSGSLNNIPSRTTTTQSSPTDAITPAPDIFPADDAKQPGRTGDLLADRGDNSKKGEEADPPNTTVLCTNHTVRPPAAIIPSTSMERAASGMVVDWFNTFYFLRENNEKAVLYLVLGVCFGIISLLVIIIVKLAIGNKKKRKAKLDVTDPAHSNAVPPNNHMEAPTLSRADSIDRIEIVRFEPRSTLRRDRDSTLRRDFESHIPLRTDFDVEDTLRSDPGDRSLNNYYG